MGKKISLYYKCIFRISPFLHFLEIKGLKVLFLSDSSLELSLSSLLKITVLCSFLFRFDGRVVAKLPFTPLSYIQGLSHRNLLGDDTTDCSFIFLYILCTMSIRQVSAHIIYLMLCPFLLSHPKLMSVSLILEVSTCCY